MVRVIIRNPWNNTGSTSFWWRIAEYSPLPWGLILFWLTHGRVKPTDPRANFIGITKIDWVADDPEVIVEEYVIGSVARKFVPPLLMHAIP